MWVLVAALLVGALAPLAFHRPLADVAASSAGSGKSLEVAADQSMLRPPSVRVELRQLPPLREYMVQASDSIPSIAARAGLSIQTLVQVNHLASGDDLTVGEVLIIPPVDGSMVSVASGESLADVAATYQADPLAIRAINRLTDHALLPAEIFIPAASVGEGPARASAAQPADARHHLVHFVWPTQGVVTQLFWQYHPGIDIANVTGTPEVAADGGRVVWAGWGSYGIYVEIDHGNGFTTVYGHMSRVLVSVGQVVSSGEEIGLMGETGRATGPHLHFEIRYHDVPQNPMDYLS